MGRPAHLETENYDLFDILKYQTSKIMEEAVLESFPAVVERINAEDDPKITQIIEGTVKLPGGSYARLRWDLEVLSPEEGRLGEKDAEEAAADA